MIFKRTIKPSLKSFKYQWKPKEFDLSEMCMPEVEKQDRPLIVWSQCYPDFTDTLCFDFDGLTPYEFLTQVNTLAIVSDKNPILKSVVAVMESSHLRTHVLVKVATKLNKSNYRAVYQAISLELGSNNDPSCSDPYRGFFAPNRIVYENPNAVGYDLVNIPPLQPPSSYNIYINKLCRYDGQNQETGEFVKGNRNNFLFKTLFKMAQERGDTGSWMEEAAYSYLQEDFPKEEIDKMITWIRKKYRTNPKTAKFQVTYGLYKNMREIGHSHEEACNSILPNASKRTHERYRAMFNKEFGIVQKGGTTGRTWKRKKIVDNNNTIAKEAV